MNNLIHVDAYYRSLNHVGEELCGDHVMIRRNEDGFIMVLADGLGSGVKASILSTLTSTIISNMMVNGMPLEDAVETIAATLPVCKERGIAYSTFAIINILYNGETHIAEFDCPSITVIRDNERLKLDDEIKNISGRIVHTKKLTVKEGDYLVSYSDGVLHAGTGMTLNFGWGEKEINDFLLKVTKDDIEARDVSRVLLANANSLYDGKPADDTTVAVAKIVKAKNTVVMVGPPSKEEDDKKVVDILRRATGKKICCGGTTSQIVARVMNKEVTTGNLLSTAGDVPPIGYIDGIDLVTEGVLTLQKANRLLTKAKDDREYEENLIYSKEQDGAFKLVKELLNSTKVTFLVGLSDNPAHDSIHYSTISLNAKIALINEMKDSLLSLGKIVNIEMF